MSPKEFRTMTFDQIRLILDRTTERRERELKALGKTPVQFVVPVGS